MDKHSHKPILNVYILWHPDADARCQPLASALYTALNHNPDKPFARCIGIPVYFRCINDKNHVAPLPIELDAAQHTLVYVLIEDHLVYVETWAHYIAEVYHAALASHGNHKLVPIALTGSAFNLHVDIARANYVRLFDLDPESVKSKLLHHVAHDLAVLLDVETPPGQPVQPIKLFISHTKRDAKALQLALALKREIDGTHVNRFFDAVDILPGHDFLARIDEVISHASLIAIRSDSYTSSPYCQQEVMLAKQKARPMVVVDVLQHQEERNFPYLSNVPVIRFNLDASPDSPEARQQLQAIIDFALLEVLRFFYVRKHFSHLQGCHYLPDDALIFSRPPEDRDLKNKARVSVVYPDPPLSAEEINELSANDIALFTPTTAPLKALPKQALLGLSVGISIFAPDTGELKALGLSETHLQNAMLDIARHCLAQGAQLVYGGDLRPNGFTENLLELVRYHNDAINKKFLPVVNYLAWPLHPTLDVAWAAQHRDALSIHKVPAPDDLIVNGLISESARSRQTPTSGYVWARCLTAMRETLLENTKARILLGGKTRGFKGKYPGLIEEALLSLEAKQPLYLLGGYGGATRVIIEALQGLSPPQLTHDYQCADPAYKGLLTEYNEQISAAKFADEAIDYQRVTERFAEFGLKALKPNGLSEPENQRLFVTTNHEEAISLVLKGLSSGDVR